MSGIPRLAAMAVLAAVGLAGMAALATMAFVFSIGTASVKLDVEATVLDRSSQAPVSGCLLAFDLDRYADSRIAEGRTDASGKRRYDVGHHQYTGSIFLPTQRERTPDLRLYLGEKPRYGTYDEVESWDVQVRFREPWLAKEAPAAVVVQRNLAHEDVVSKAPGGRRQARGFSPLAPPESDGIARAEVRLGEEPDGRRAYSIALTLLLDAKQIAACQAVPAVKLEKEIVETQSAARLYNAGKYQEALEVYRTALAGGQEPAWAYRGVADCLAHLGRGKEAATAYRRAVAIAPADNDTLYWYANSLIGQSNQEAVAQFEKLIEREPRDARGSIGLANALYELNRYPEVIRALDHARRLCPTCLNDNDRAIYADSQRLVSP